MKDVLAELARVKAIFQLRAITSAMGLSEDGASNRDDATNIERIAPTDSKELGGDQ